MAKCKDIIRQLQAVLPKLTTYFNDELTINTISKIGDIVTVKTNTNHGMKSNEMVLVKDVKVKNPIDTATLNSDGDLVLTFIIPHDKTFGYTETLTAQLKYFNNLGVQLSDNIYTIKDVPDEYTLILDHQSIPIGFIGYLLENRLDGYNGFFVITVPNSSLDTFTYVNQGLILSADTSISKIIGKFRIAAISDIKRVFEHYEKQTSDDKLWIWVIMGASKGSFTRESQTDATARFTKSEDYAQELFQSFHIIVAVPTSHSTGGAEAVDLMQDIRTYLLKSLCGVFFDSGFTKGERYMCSYAEDSFYDYAGSYYLHNFVFENVSQLSQDDICDNDDTRAFRQAEIKNAFQFDNYKDTDRSIVKTDL